MLSEIAPVKGKIPWVKLAVVAVVLLAGAFFLLRGLNLRELVDRGMALIRAAGPGVFFTAMALLPALGAPLLGFTIPAGEAFAARLTLGGVIALALVAIAVNLALTYWLARYALRPLLLKLVQRYGYNVPRVTAENALSVTLLVRLTPGPPFFMQGYILGLAEVPFRLYMVVSWLAVLPWSLGAIIMGQGILNGNFKVALTGMAVLGVAVVAVQQLRKKYAKRAT
jgi:uncharacterized membrane protein YdjX (TVP38/TMEM64 family)